MIAVDTHVHTCYSHARNSVADMFQAARDRGLTIFGYSEHSPRPEGYNYPVEYREHLTAHYGDYVREVSELRAATVNGPTRVLFGLEMDWFEDEYDFVRAACERHPFDFIIGSTHFLGRWGFDGGPEPWLAMSEPERFDAYTAYFKTWRKMIDTGLFNTVGHPDLIKIFTIDSFHRWLSLETSQRQVRDCLSLLKTRGMSMEVSSAGLRKPCREVYPCPLFMRMASELELPVTFASDCHSTSDVAFGFPLLANYARAFGYSSSVIFIEKQPVTFTF